MKRRNGFAKDNAEYSTFMGAKQLGVKNPITFYHMKLEYLKQKRREKEICSICGEKAAYIDIKWFKKNIYYCEKHKTK